MTDRNEKNPPLYKWLVKHSGATLSFEVEAAYSVVEDSGHMVLKGADHNPVFTAEPGIGCTFERRGRVTAPGAGALAAQGECPHGFPPTVRCHECKPVTSPGAQAEADAAYIRRGAITLPEAKRAHAGGGGGVIDDGSRL